MPTVPEFEEILRILVHHEVDLIVVGGLAATLHGSPVLTEDVDVLYGTSPENISRLLEALRELHATYNDPAGRQFEPDANRLATMNIHLLKTRFGRLDLLRRIGDGSTKATVVRTAEGGAGTPCPSLPAASKRDRAQGR